MGILGRIAGFYSQVLIPRLCDFVLDRASVAAQRRALLAHAQGNVLEIGFGTGLNLAHYPDTVARITSVDPNPGMHRVALRRIRRSHLQVEQRVLSGERLPFAEGSFDTVVSTFTLCSIPDVTQALAEVHRVLRPRGRFLFLEHGLSPEQHVRRWQRRLNWLQRRLADGCHLDRDMRALVGAQPFAALNLEQFYLSGLPKTHGYLYRGLAVR